MKVSGKGEKVEKSRGKEIKRDEGKNKNKRQGGK